MESSETSEKQKMAEIVGGLAVRDLFQGGAVFELRSQDLPEEDGVEEKECLEALERFSKLECLDPGDKYEGDEPFDSIAKKMTDLLDNGKIKKRILRAGYGSNPEDSSVVRVDYNAYIQHEAFPFDSTYARKKPFTYIIGNGWNGEVIEGLEIAIKSMKINEKAQFLIDPDLAYRESGFSRIPPNSTVLFEIELLGTEKSEEPEKNIREFSQLYPFCLGQSVKGKRSFRVKDYLTAIKEYKIAVDRLEGAIYSNHEEQEKGEVLLVRLYTNLLVCYTLVQNPKKGCICAQQIHTVAKGKTVKVSSKVYFNHAKCLKMLGNFDRAQRELDQARRMEPKNAEVLQECLALRKAREENKKQGKPLAQTFADS